MTKYGKMYLEFEKTIDLRKKQVILRIWR